jgi:hypothetical protein
MWRDVFAEVLMKEKKNVTSYLDGKLIHNYLARHRLHV